MVVEEVIQSAAEFEAIESSQIEKGCQLRDRHEARMDGGFEVALKSPCHRRHLLYVRLVREIRLRYIDIEASPMELGSGVAYGMDVSDNGVEGVAASLRG